MAGVKIARAFFVVGCVHMTATIRDQILKWQSKPTPMKSFQALIMLRPCRDALGAQGSSAA